MSQSCIFSPTKFRDSVTPLRHTVTICTFKPLLLYLPSHIFFKSRPWWNRTSAWAVAYYKFIGCVYVVPKGMKGSAFVIDVGRKSTLFNFRVQKPDTWGFRARQLIWCYFYAINNRALQFDIYATGFLMGLKFNRLSAMQRERSRSLRYAIFVTNLSIA